jgi:hypothetical protein
MNANSAPARGGYRLRGLLHAFEKVIAALTVRCAYIAILALDRPALFHHLPRRMICVENPAVSTACHKSCSQLIQRGTEGLEKIVLHSLTPMRGSLSGIASY